MIVVGVDAHMETHTAAAIDGITARRLAELTVAAREPGFAELLAWARGLELDRVWAIEDVRNLSGSLERFLLGAGERVLRATPKLMAGQRKSAREFGKSDSIDATVIARAVLREERLQPAALPVAERRQIKLLADQREHLLAEANRHQRRLRWLLHDLDPELQPAGRTLNQPVVLDRLARRLARRPQTIEVRICRELVAEIRRLTKRCDQLEAELKPLVRRYAPTLVKVCGVATLTGAKLIAEIDDVRRFATDARLAMYGGVAPLDASSGRQRRHRLNRSGNRQLNRALYLITVTQLRVYAPAREYLARRLTEGKTKAEAMRALMRYIARHIYRILTAEAQRRAHAPLPIGTAPLRCLT
jgi:transposase